MHFERRLNCTSLCLKSQQFFIPTPFYNLYINLTLMLLRCATQSVNLAPMLCVGAKSGRSAPPQLRCRASKIVLAQLFISTPFYKFYISDAAVLQSQKFGLRCYAATLLRLREHWSMDCNPHSSKLCGFAALCFAFYALRIESGSLCCGFSKRSSAVKYPKSTQYAIRSTQYESF